MTTEFQAAYRLANKVLEDAGRDPDDDLAVLARQFLRAIEREDALRAVAGLGGTSRAHPARS